MDFEAIIVLEEAEAEVKFNINFQGQPTFWTWADPTKRPDPTSREYRHLVTDTMCAQEELEDDGLCQEHGLNGMM